MERGQVCKGNPPEAEQHPHRSTELVLPGIYPRWSSTLTLPQSSPVWHRGTEDRVPLGQGTRQGHPRIEMHTAEWRCLAAAKKMRRRSASTIKELRTSITMTMSIGDKGSPYHRPRAWERRRPSRPLTSTLVLAEDSKMAIKSVQHCGKPMWRSSSSTNGHDTESNAFAISTFISTQEKVLVCSHLQVRLTVHK